MSCVQVYVIFTLLVAVSVTQILPFPEVTIEQGTLRGKFDTSANGRQFAAFRGIPYAQAPVGKQRFKEPKAPKPWVGVYNAVDAGPECLQYSHFSYNVQGDEDCLFVNVFTPSVPVNAQSSRQYDVIVYIHGGAFMFSNGNSYGPYYLLDRDIVYVTFNYRLGPLELYSPSGKFEELNSKWNELLPHLLDFNLTVEAELKEDVCNDIKSFYLNNKTASENPSQVIQMIGDRLFVSCGEEGAKVQAETSSAPVYFYYFTYRGSKSFSNLFTHDERNLGVSHADDNMYFVNYPAFSLEVTAQHKEMSQRFLDFLTSYARDGIPRFTPNFVFPAVKEGLPALQYINIKSPSEFVQEQSTDLGHSEFWFNLPLHEMVNIAKQEALLGEATTAKDEL